MNNLRLVRRGFQVLGVLQFRKSHFLRHKVWMNNIGCNYYSTRFGSRTLATIVSDGRKELEDSSWITDKVGVLTGREREQVEDVIRELIEKYGVELSVMIEASLPDSHVTARERALSLFNEWEIGSKSRRNGILVYMVVDCRRLEIITGDGLSHAFPDLDIKNALNLKVIPEINRGDKGAGIIEAVNICADALWKQCRLDNGAAWIFREKNATGPSFINNDSPEEQRADDDDKNKRDNNHQNTSSSAHRFRNLLIMGMFLGVLYKVRNLNAEQEREEQTCKQCKHYPMESLGVSNLSLCQRTELGMNSAQYVKYRCSNCGDVGDMIRKEIGGSRFKTCGYCHCRSINVNKVIRAPSSRTTYGLEIIHDECSICGSTSETRRFIPPSGDDAPIDLRKHQGVISTTTGSRHGGGSSSGGGAGVSF